jgi:hypothetical protein
MNARWISLTLVCLAGCGSKPAAKKPLPELPPEVDGVGGEQLIVDNKPKLFGLFSSAKFGAEIERAGIDPIIPRTMLGEHDGKLTRILLRLDYDYQRAFAADARRYWGEPLLTKECEIWLNPEDGLRAVADRTDSPDLHFDSYIELEKLIALFAEQTNSALPNETSFEAVLASQVGPVLGVRHDAASSIGEAYIYTVRAIECSELSTVDVWLRKDRSGVTESLSMLIDDCEGAQARIVSVLDKVVGEHRQEGDKHLFAKSFEAYPGDAPDWHVTRKFPRY